MNATNELREAIGVFRSICNTHNLTPVTLGWVYSAHAGDPNMGEWCAGAKTPSGDSISIASSSPMRAVSAFLLHVAGMPRDTKVRW